MDCGLQEAPDTNNPDLVNFPCPHEAYKLYGGVEKKLYGHEHLLQYDCPRLYTRTFLLDKLHDQEQLMLGLFFTFFPATTLTSNLISILALI